MYEFFWIELTTGQVLDICEYSVERQNEDGVSFGDVALPGEGIGECEITVINQTELIFETHGENAGCVHQTRYVGPLPVVAVLCITQPAVSPR